VTPQPSREKRSFFDNIVCPNRGKKIVKDGICPFYEGIASFQLIFFRNIFVSIEIKLDARTVEQAMNNDIEELNYT
jgi:hypothetical protein